MLLLCGLLFYAVAVGAEDGSYCDAQVDAPALNPDSNQNRRLQRHDSRAVRIPATCTSIESGAFTSSSLQADILTGADAVITAGAIPAGVITIDPAADMVEAWVNVNGATFMIR